MKTSCIQNSAGGGRFVLARRISCFVLLAALAAVFGAAPCVQGAIVSGYSEYYIPGDEEQMWRVFDALATDAGGALDINDGMHTVISVVANGDDTTVYYDHWEDGYDFDPEDPNNTFDEKFTLSAGEVLTLEDGSIPVNPRGTAVYYDGRDRLFVAGATVTVSRSSWTEDEGTTLALSWSVFPLKPFLTNYTIPVGEDLAGGALSYTDFQRVYVLVQSIADDNLVTIDDPGSAGVEVSVNLDAGQVAELFRIDAGTAVAAEKPVQVQFVVGSVSRGLYEMRGFEAVPDSLWDTEYYSPVSGAFAGATDLYIYNPNGYPIIVDYEDTTGSGKFTVSARSTLSYQDGAGRYVPNGSGVYLRSDDIFWGIGSADTESTSYDWGFSLVPVSVLSDDYFLGWAPGTSDPTPSANGSPAFVTAVQDETTVFVDYSPTDGVIDFQTTIDRLESLKIFDPDDQNTGVHIYATGPLALAWGQDPDTATPYVPYLDLGTSTLPNSPEWIDLTLAIDKTVAPSVVAPVAGRTSTVTLKIDTFDFPVLGVSVVDELPSGWSYVANSTVITLPDSTLIEGTAANPAVSGQTLTWDNAALNNLDMGIEDTLTVRFDIETDPSVSLGIYVNNAQASGFRLEGTQIFTPFDTASINVTSLTIDKDTTTPGVPAGGTASYTIRLENISDGDLTDIVVSDSLPSGFGFDAGTVSQGPGVSRTVPIDPSAGDTNLTWGTWTIPAGEFVQIDFDVDVSSGVDSGTYDNTAEAGYDDGVAVRTINDIGTAGQDLGTPSDADPEQDEDVTITALTIDKETTTSIVSIPGAAVYRITLENTSDSPVTGVTVTDILPTGFSYVAASAVFTETGAARTVTTNPADGASDLLWGTWTIDAGGSVVIEFDAAVGTDAVLAVYDNTAGATSNETGAIDDVGSVGQDKDTPPGQDPEGDEDVTLVWRLTVDKDAVTPITDPNNPLAEYTISVANTGNEDATSVTVADTLPAGFTYDAASLSISETGAVRTATSEPADGAAVLSWGAWTISPGGSVEIAFSADTSAAAAGIYDNTASVTSAEGGTIDDDGAAAQDLHTPPGEDPESDEDVTVYTTPTADLEIFKSHTGSFIVGQTNTFYIEVKNLGLSPVANPAVISVSDTLPAGLSYVSSSTVGGTGTNWVVDASADPTVSWTYTPPAGTPLAPGESLPLIEVQVTAGAAGVPEVDNTAAVSVSGTYIDPNADNDTATDTIAVAEGGLSTSTKTVVDINGGDVLPGDTLRYTITVTESGGAAVSGAGVTDDIPANVDSFTVESIPAGAADNSTGAGTGANGTGFMDVSGIDIPANGSVTLVFTVAVAAGTASGTAIDNTATITNPFGPGASPAAPTVVVKGQQLPASGTKPLYLNETQDLTRALPAAPQSAVEVPNDGSTTWTLSPVLQSDLVLDGDVGSIPVTLTLRNGYDGTDNDNYIHDVTVSIDSTATPQIGSVTESVSLNNFSDTTVTFSVPIAADTTVPAGAALTLEVYQEGSQYDDAMDLYPIAGDLTRSRVDATAETVVNVDSVVFYDAAYPAGSPASFASVGETVFIRAQVGDPFGSADITGATVDVVDGEGVLAVDDAVMTEVFDSGAGTKAYEYALTIPAEGPLDNWVATVTAAEGTEGTVTHSGIGSITILPITGVDLAVSKARSTAFVLDQEAEYTIAVSNLGTDPETTPVTVSDTLPAGLVYVSSSAAGWTVDDSANPTISWTYPVSAGAPLNPGESLPPITLTVLVQDAALPSVSNTATVAGGTADPNPGNNDSTDTAPVLTFGTTKTAAGPDPLYPGDVLTYTIEVVNSGDAPVTNVTVRDPLAEGVTYDSGFGTQITAPVRTVRVTEYYIAPGEFTGTAYDLSLDSDLAGNYFAVVQGSDGNGTGNGNRGPDENYAALTADPFGTGDLGTTGHPDVIRLQRGNAEDAWVGVVTVVESLQDHNTSGFRLLDVQRVVHAGASTSGADSSSIGWSDIGRVLLMGGFNGAGCTTAETGQNDTKVCHARIYPSGTDAINWTRNGGGASLSTAVSTVMVVEWGSEWTVQRTRVTGTSGGDGADTAGEYDTAAIFPVSRSNTWVWGTGHTNDNGIGDAAEGVLITLGDGVGDSSDPVSTVAVGSEYNAYKDFEVYTMTHPDLAVDYRFKPDGNENDLTVDVAVDNAAGNRMALSYNGQNGTGTAYPRPMFSARYLDNQTVRLERRRSGQNFPAWVQGIDFSGFSTVASGIGGAPIDLVSADQGYSLLPGETMTVLFRVTVDDPPVPGTLSNTVYVNSSEFVDPATSTVEKEVRTNPTLDFVDAAGNPLEPGGDFNTSDQETIHLRVYDPDRNTNPTVIETVQVTVTSPTGDSETITLYETGTDTGLFMNNSLGAMAELFLTEESTSIADDGYLYVEAGQTTGIAASYTDPFGTLAEEQAASSALVITRAVIGGFATYVDGSRVVAAWETVSEVGTLGFFLERRNADSGAWWPVHDGILPALRRSPQGGFYRAADPGAEPGKNIAYRLVELEAKGKRIVYGPYTAKADAPLPEMYSLPADAAFLRTPRPVHSSSAASAPEVRSMLAAPLADSPAATGDRIRIEVAEAGLYTIGADQIAALLGKTVPEVSTQIAAGGLLLENRQTSIPWLASAANDRIYFYGEGIDSIYTAENVYWLSEGTGAIISQTAVLGDVDGSGGVDLADAVAALQIASGMAPEPAVSGYAPTVGDADGNGRIGLAEALGVLQSLAGLRDWNAGAPAPAPAEEAFRDTVHFEEDLWEIPDYVSDPESDYWVWADLVTNVDGYDRFSHTFTLAGLAPEAGTARIDMHLKGTSAAPGSEDHRVSVSLNGTVIGEGVSDGFAEKTASFSFAASLLAADGENTLTVTAIGDDSADYTTVSIDSFDLTYPRYYRAVGDRLRLTGGGNPVVSAQGFSSNDLIVLDVEDPLDPRRIGHAEIFIDEPAAGQYRISFAPADGLKPYLVQSLASAGAPASASAASESSLAGLDSGADYVIIAPASMKDAVQPLADLRQARQLQTLTATVEEIMDAYNDGVFNPEAIRWFLKDMHQRLAPQVRYAVLVGDGTYDYKDHLGMGENLVPPLMLGTPEGLVASDNLYGDVDGDGGLPEIAVGRLPVSSAVELASVIDKIAAYENAPEASWQDTIVLAADGPDGSGDFPADSDAAAALLPRQMLLNKIYLSTLSLADARSRLLAAIDEGALLFNYIGHGAFDRFEDGGLLAETDLPALANGGRLPIVSGFTCITGRFEVPGYDFLSEQLLLKDGGGAAAVWSTAGLSIHRKAKVLNESFFKAIFLEGKTVLGDVVAAAIDDYIRRTGDTFMPYIYNLMGDPALRLPAYIPRTGEQR